jgi:hypothetical protein
MNVRERLAALDGERCEYCGEIAYGGVRVAVKGHPELGEMFFHSTCHQLMLELLELSRSRHPSRLFPDAS